MADLAHLIIKVEVQGDKSAIAGLKGISSEGAKAESQSARLSNSATGLSRMFSQVGASMARTSAIFAVYGSSATSAASAMGAMSTSMARSSSLAGGLAAAVLVAGAAVASFVGITAIKSGLEFNRTMEDSRIAIGAIVGATQDIRNSQGQLVTGQEAFAAATVIGEGLMDKIRLLALETVATVPELVEGMQAMIGPATAAGFKLEQIPEFVQRGTQAMAAMQIPMVQIRTELKALVTGNITMHDILARNLNITGEQIKNWKEQGTLVQEIMSRLDAFKYAGQAAMMTMSGAASNLKDAVGFVAGEATKPLYESARMALLEMQNAMIATGSEAEILSGKAVAIRENFQPVVNMLDDISLILGVIVETGVQAFISGIEALGQAWGENRSEIFNLIDAVWDFLGVILQGVGFVLDLGAGLASLIFLGGGFAESLRFVTALLQVAAEDLTEMYNWAAAVYSAIAEWVTSTGILSEALNVVVGIFQTIYNWVVYIVSSIPLIGQGMINLASDVSDKVKGAANAVKTDLQGTLDRITAKMKESKENPDRLSNSVKLLSDKLKQNAAASEEAKKKLGGYTANAKKAGDAAGKGAGGADKLGKAMQKLADFISKLDEEYTRMSGGELGKLNAWRDKQIRDLEKIEQETGRSAEARAAIERNYGIKREEIEDKWKSYKYGVLNDEEGQITQQHDKMLKQFKGFLGAEQIADQEAQNKRIEIRERNIDRLVDAQKGMLSALETLAPTEGTKIDIQEKILELEHRRKLETLAVEESQHKITKPLADQLILLENQTYQLKLQAMERERLMGTGAWGGVQVYAQEQIKKGETLQGQWGYDMMGVMRDSVGKAAADGFMSALQGKKVDLNQIGIDMAGEFVKKTIDLFISQLWVYLLQIVMDSFGSGSMTMTSAAVTAQMALATGGQMAASAMVSGAVSARSILGSGSTGGGGTTPGAGTGGGPFGFLSGLLTKGISYIMGGGYTPAYASGGIVTKPTFAMVGEGGPEKITPLGQSGGAVNVTVINQTGVAATAQASWDMNGLKIVLLKEVSADIERGGMVDRAVSRKYGLTRQTVNRGT